MLLGELCSIGVKLFTVFVELSAGTVQFRPIVREHVAFARQRGAVFLDLQLTQFQVFFTVAQVLFTLSDVVFQAAPFGVEFFFRLIEF